MFLLKLLEDVILDVGFCMRGDAQNIDMNKYMVDTF